MYDAGSYSSFYKCIETMRESDVPTHYPFDQRFTFWCTGLLSYPPLFLGAYSSPIIIATVYKQQGNKSTQQQTTNKNKATKSGVTKWCDKPGGVHRNHIKYGRVGREREPPSPYMSFHCRSSWILEESSLTEGLISFRASMKSCSTKGLRSALEICSPFSSLSMSSRSGRYAAFTHRFFRSLPVNPSVFAAISKIDKEG